MLSLNNIHASLTNPTHAPEIEFDGDADWTVETWLDLLSKLSVEPAFPFELSESWEIMADEYSWRAESTAHPEAVLYLVIDHDGPCGPAWAIMRHFPEGAERDGDIDTRYLWVRGYGHPSPEELIAFATRLERACWAFVR